ncbi:MAG: FRG domain-containing protein [Tenericutes bacterium]|nr:FRG domain-containing protein [Mycoplasmatota bacterium]
MNTAKKLSNRLRGKLQHKKVGKPNGEIFMVMNLKNLLSYIDIIKPKENDRKLIYRGLSSSNYSPLPSFDRLEKSYLEDYIVLETKEIFDKEISPMNKWTMSQHLGTPTRYLDFTYDFFVALYFAVSNTSDINEDGVIMVTEVKMSDINKYNNYVEFISEMPIKLNELSNNPCFFIEKINGLNLHGINNTYIFSVLCDDNETKKLIHKWNISIDLVKNVYGNHVYVESDRNLNRQINQQSVMLFHHNYIIYETSKGYAYEINRESNINSVDELIFTLDYKRYSTKYYYDNYIFIVIHKSLKRELKEMLEKLKINKEFLFPNDDGN